MYYLIRGLCPRTDIDMGRHGFQIDLHKTWTKLVAASELDQNKVDHAIKTLGDSWLDACGYGRKMEDGERLYNSRTSIRVSWGEWGTEHITVPGNACGLDIDRGHFGGWLGGLSLLPHNVDCWSQVQLLLIVFTWFAETVALNSRNTIKEMS